MAVGAAHGSLRFSVAMCTYNGEHHLEEQLESLARQQYLPYEVVICDDGSTDATLAIAEKFARQAPFPTRIVRNPVNLGYSRNFAKAVQLCSGDLIAFSDQDDIWYPHKLARLVEIFRSDASVAGIFSDGDLIGSNSNQLAGSLWASFRFSAADQRRFQSGHALEVLLQRNVVTGMTFAFHSSWKSQFDDMPRTWSHDSWLALMLAMRAKLFACPEHLVAYRLHGSQQIGVPITPLGKYQYLRTNGIGAYLQLSHDRNDREYKTMAVLFDDLLAALAKSASAADRDLVAQAQAKANHAHRGSRVLSLGRFRRWPIVLRHVNDYRQYCPTGAQAILRDLLI